MAKWIPLILSVLTALAGAFLPMIQDYITAHPQTAVVLAGIGGIIASVLKSPLDKG